jgi:hypothetical protein
MVQLDDLGDYIWMIGWAAFFGALGGIAAYIMAGRQAAVTGKTDAADVPETPIGRRLVDLGTRGLGSVFLGAVAAVISLYFLAPITTTVTEGADGVSSIDRYNVIQLVALALVVGAAGETVIAAAQARLIAAVQAEKTQTTVAVAQAQVEEVGQRAMATMERLAATGTGTTGETERGGPMGAPNGAVATHAAQEELRQHVEAAKSTIRAIAE